MCSKNKEISLGFTSKRFNPGIHICLLYRDENERREIISKYLESGLLNNEKLEYFSDIMKPDELKKWLKDIGIEAQPNQKSQFTITPAEQIYCPSGRFKSQDMLNRLCDYYDTALEEGFTGARVTGETTWLKKKLPGTENFLEYEAQINNTIKNHPVTVMCQYDVRLFDGSLLFDILQVHPLLVVHGQIVRNPAYRTPEEFLNEFQARK